MSGAPALGAAEILALAGAAWVAARLARRAPSELAAFVLPVAGYFLALESTGVTSGRFRYTPAFHVWLGNVPLFVPLCWILFMRGAMAVSDRLLGRAAAARGGRAAALLLALGDGVVIAVTFAPINLLAEALTLWHFDDSRGRLVALARDFVGALLAVALFGLVYRGLRERAARPRLVLTAVALGAIVGARVLVARWIGTG